MFLKLSPSALEVPLHERTYLQHFPSYIHVCHAWEKSPVKEQLIFKYKVNF